MIAVGIDAGRRYFGYAVVERRGAQFGIVHSGVVTIPDSNVITACGRVFDITLELAKEWNPEVWGLEYSHFRGLENGAVVGASIACMVQAGGSVHLVYPSQVRALVAGNGRATKRDIQRLLRAYGLPTGTTTHASDAAAAAITALILQGSPLR
ncbi:MAG: crossover junction endodeoxyribonuclease RuvC [bacterium JZ-2024 1]